MTLLRKLNSAWPDYLDGYFGKEFSDNFWLPKTGINVPAINLVQSNDAFFVELAVPGFDKKDFKIDFSNNVLTIGATKEESSEDSNRKFTKREFFYGSFERAFTLPDSVDGEKIEASYDNGILKISIPKKDQTKLKASKAIEIK